MQTTAKHPAAPALTLDLELSARLTRQNQQIMRHEYQPLGRLEQVHVEAAGIAHLAGNPLLRNPKRHTGMDWYKTGPGIGWSASNELLIVGAFAPPPPIPDPNHQPEPKYTQPTTTEGPRLIWDSVKPRMMVQNMADYADCVVRFASGEWLVFQPVHSVLLLSAKGGFTIITTKADAAGRSCCLIYDPRSKRAHFLYGAYEIVDHTGAGRQSLAEGSFGGQDGALAAFLEAEESRKRGGPDAQTARLMALETERAAGQPGPQVRRLTETR